MNTTSMAQALASFITSHSTSFEHLSEHQTQIFELGAMAMVAEHYRRRGYHITPVNLVAGKFRVKYSSHGYPWNFSHFKATRDAVAVGIHCNLAVFGAYGADDAIYVVDVGVTAYDAVPLTKPQEPEESWVAVETRKLITFIEAKKLVAYPMLLAQFLGIVHEIKPTFLRGIPGGFFRGLHFLPTLVTIGGVTANARRIRSGFARRGFFVNIVPYFDAEIARMEAKPRKSPIGCLMFPPERGWRGRKVPR